MPSNASEIAEAKSVDQSGEARAGEPKVLVTGLGFIVAAEWHGFAKMMDSMGSGQVFAVAAPAAGAEWP